MMVDDEPVLRTLVSYTLEDADFVVIEAGSADEALRILQDEPHGTHVLFTDVQMPGSIDGRALAHHVSRRWPHIGVMVTSARPMPAEHLPHGCRFLAKPYDLGDVLDHVQTLALASCQ